MQEGKSCFSHQSSLTGIHNLDTSSHWLSPQLEQLQRQGGVCRSLKATDQYGRVACAQRPNPASSHLSSSSGSCTGESVEGEGGEGRGGGDRRLLLSSGGCRGAGVVVGALLLVDNQLSHLSDDCGGVVGLLCKRNNMSSHLCILAL